MIQTSSVLHPGKPGEEVFDEEDKAQLSNFVTTASSDYDKLIAEAESKLHEAKRQVVRAEHELKRLKNHQGALTKFSEKHNLKEEK